jgi:DNA-binding NarL/FixJ family response regulator
MGRLTKKELRALLECIKECYPVCDRETFRQRVLSRLAKIVPTEILSHNVVKPRMQRNAPATHASAAYASSVKKIFEQRTYEHPVFVHHKEPAPNGTSKNLVERDQLLLNLLSPYLTQAYRNAGTVTYIQQKLSLVDRARNRLNLGIIILAADGKVRLATACAAQQLTNYLGHRALRGKCLPEVLRRWVKQQEVVLKGNAEIPLRPRPLVLQREEKRLVIRLVADMGQSLLLLEEQPIKPQPQSLAPCRLSAREVEVLNWLAQGKTNKEIAAVLALSPRTVQKHLEHIYQKLGVDTRTAAAARAYEIASKVAKQTGMFLFVVINSLIS